MCNRNKFTDMKQIIFILSLLLLPAGMTAQVDDLYFVPKKKTKKEIVITSNGNTVIKNANQNISTENKNVKSGSNIINGINEDEYNRRPTSASSNYKEYAEEQATEYAEESVEEVADYTYSSRIVRFHSPRRAVVLSSPLYWDVVYNSGLSNWTIYDDGIYWDVYPDYGYTTIYYSSPWYSSWNWYFGAGWGLSFGWGYSPWYWGWHST